MITKRPFIPRRDLRIIEGTIQEILKHTISQDYVFVRLTDLTPVVGAMEQIRTVYPNAMHVERKTLPKLEQSLEGEVIRREQMDELSLFKAFHQEILGEEPSEIAQQLFEEVLQEMLTEEREIKEVVVK